jgi:hypothetical protein
MNMKILTCLLLCLACASAAFAGEGVSASPSWERAADARLWSRATEEGDMPLNAYCEAGDIERASELRREAARALESAPESDAALALTVVLIESERRSIAPSRGSGASLYMGQLARSLALADTSGIRKAGRPVPRVAAPVMSAAAPNGGGQRHSKDFMVLKGMRYPSSAHSRVNLVGYSLDEAKADYFRLFLYLYDDIPDADTHISSLRTPSAFCYSLFSSLRLFNKEIRFHHINSHQHYVRSSPRRWESALSNGFVKYHILPGSLPQSNQTSLHTANPIPFPRGIA